MPSCSSGGWFQGMFREKASFPTNLEDFRNSLAMPIAKLKLKPRFLSTGQRTLDECVARIDQSQRDSLELHTSPPQQVGIT